MMKAYVCFEHYYNFCDEWKSVIQIVSNELDAMNWVCEFKETETQWRSYVEMEVK